jgi:hypothetical protein
MAQKITLSLKESNVKFAKRQAGKTKTSISKMVDEYLDLLQRIEAAYKKEKLTSFVKRFSGMVSTGKDENVKSIS